MLCSMRLALSIFLLMASVALAQPPVPPPVPPFAPPANPSPLPPAIPAKAAPNPVPVAPNAPPALPPGTMEPSKPYTPPSHIGGRTLDAWLADFKSSDPTVRERAVKVIPAFGVDAARKVAIKPLTGMLDDTDPGVRINAILIITSIGFEKYEDLKPAIDKMASMLSNTLPGSVVRLHATRAIGSFGLDAHTAINGVVLVADDPSWETRQAAAITLGRIGGIAFEDKAIQTSNNPNNLIPIVKRGPSKAAMDKLIFKLIRDPSAAVRMEACHSLVLLGPPYTQDPNNYPAVAKPYIDIVSARVKGLELDPSVKVWLMLLHIMYDDRELDKT